ncbi:MAG: hypothetical protein K0Q50_1027 [Vampirovibrio sp.]|jgi:hypothetical protein|nr:hypothetical protein [Vampirovibrio sp.]
MQKRVSVVTDAPQRNAQVVFLTHACVTAPVRSYVGYQPIRKAGHTQTDGLEKRVKKAVGLVWDVEGAFTAGLFNADFPLADFNANP